MNVSVENVAEVASSDADLAREVPSTEIEGLPQWDEGLIYEITAGRCPKSD